MYPPSRIRDAIREAQNMDYSLKVYPLINYQIRNGQIIENVKIRDCKVRIKRMKIFKVIRIVKRQNSTRILSKNQLRTKWKHYENVILELIDNQGK